MPIVRHNYTTVHAEQNAPLTGKFQINSGITFVDLKEDSNVSSEAGKGFTIVYDFTTKYGEDLGKVNIRGEVFYVAPKEEAKEITDLWAEKKILPEKTVLQVGNYCLMKAQMKAIAIANDLNLQSPVQLPKFEAKK